MRIPAILSFLITGLLLLQNNLLLAQQRITAFNDQRNQINRKGMIALGSWGAVNVITGAIGQGSSSGSTKYFHRMNLYCGAVNIALSSIGLLGIRKEQNQLDLTQSFKKQTSVERLFLFNTGLDLAYVATGVYLVERGKRSVNPDRYKGYGQGVILQGIGLFVFDGLLYMSHSRHGKKLLPVLNNLSFTGNSAGIILSL